MMHPLYSSWNNALDYSRYPRGNTVRGNTAPTVLPQMHYRYRGSTVHSVPSPRYYRAILPIPTVITAVTAVLLHSHYRVILYYRHTKYMYPVYHYVLGYIQNNKHFYVASDYKMVIDVVVNMFCPINVVALQRNTISFFTSDTIKTAFSMTS